MIAAKSVATELPAVGTTMFLALADGVNFRSWLASVDEETGTFTVAAPLETVDSVVTLGQQFDLFWVPPQTRVLMPVRVVGVSDEAPFRWTLSPAGAPIPSNRREFVRGGGGASVHLTNPVDTPTEADPEATPLNAEAALLDISEGGMRLWIDEPLPLSPGDRLSASVRLNGPSDVTLTGTVLTVRRAPHGDPGLHVVLTFNPEETLAQMIRLYVRTWELTERRRAAA